jgi:imidazolonepropionase-like amidohydrolase
MKGFLLVLIFLTQIAYSQKTILHCGQLIDVKTSTIQKEMSIIVEGNKISDVQKGYAAAGPNDKIIDLKNRTVMPGLIDMHVHLEHETNPNAYLQGFTMNPADYAFQSVVYAERTLMAGFTTVRDLGGSGVNISLRNAINKGLVKGQEYLLQARQ